MNWEKRCLSDLVTLRSGGTPRKSESRYWGGDIPWLTSKDLTTSRIHDGHLHVTEEGVANGTRLMPEDTVMFVVRGMSLASEFRVSITKTQCAFNQDIKAVVCNEDILSNFLFYSLFARRDRIKALAGEASHGTKKLETPIIKSISLMVPNLCTQENVVKIASAYDDLIDNNRRRITLIEEAARLLYREWFVHFRFPGHEHVNIVDGLPEGWDRRTLGSVLNLQRGFDLPVNRRVPGGIPVYGSTGIVGEHNVAKVNFPTLITGRSGSLGRVCYVDDPCWPLNTSLWVTDFKAVSIYFAYFMLSSMDLAKFNAGASVPTLDRKVAHAVNVLVPTRDIATQFDKQMEVVFTQKKLLNLQIEKLAQARDLLLPRLMMGEIAV